jgi:hypothetical protein
LKKKKPRDNATITINNNKNRHPSMIPAMAPDERPEGAAVGGVDDPVGTTLEVTVEITMGTKQQLIIKKQFIIIPQLIQNFPLKPTCG